MMNLKEYNLIESHRNKETILIHKEKMNSLYKIRDLPELNRHFDNEFNGKLILRWNELDYRLFIGEPEIYIVIHIYCNKETYNNKNILKEILDDINSFFFEYKLTRL